MLKSYCRLLALLVFVNALPPTATAAQIFTEAEDARCISKISRAVCLASESHSGRCNRAARKHTVPFVELYKKYPPYLKKMMCHLRQIRIEGNDSMSLGGVNEAKDSKGNVTGGILIVRRSLVEGTDDSAYVQSWREQLNFGANPKIVSVSTELPKVIMEPNRPNDLFFYVVTHELGHLFDFTNRLNFVFFEPHNHLGDDFWSWISWDKETGKPYEDFNFPLRKSLCFYRCAGKTTIPPDSQDELYSSLRHTNFLTPYAATNSSEDFAESFAIYVLSTNLSVEISIQTKFGQIYPIVDRMRRDPLMQQKRAYIENFLSSDIKYPGQRN